jgi:acyl-coenzyme A synthetase/AMP-(fatty) acid ligase
VNFVRDVVETTAPEAVAVVERTRGGGRREHTFGDLARRGGAVAGTLQRLGVRRGDVVLTLIGNRIEWVEVLLACFRTGAVALPCTEQLRAEDLAHRLAAAAPAAVVADERNRGVLEAAGPACPVLLVPDPTMYAAPPPPCADLASDDPCLITFTSGTAGPPNAVLHGQRYLLGQRLQAEHWFAARPGDLAWCTASTGWSKSARNAFLAPWLCGATALLHDGRFDPEERVAVASAERVAAWCMAPTEYRIIAKRGAVAPIASLHSLVAAGEALDPETLRAWQEGTGVEVRDGYGQTETGQITGNPYGAPARPGSMGRPLPGVRAWVDPSGDDPSGGDPSAEQGELVVDPATVPTFFLRYLGQPPPTGVWRTGDQVRRVADGYLYFQGRTDDVIISAGYRIGPFEVESVLARHPAVADVAVVAAPDAERGSVVRAIVVPQQGHAPSPALAAQLQEFVKRHTAPYKYPRIVDFAPELPKTSSGKIVRRDLRLGATTDTRP